METPWQMEGALQLLNFHVFNHDQTLVYSSNILQYKINSGDIQFEIITTCVRAPITLTPTVRRIPEKIDR